MTFKCFDAMWAEETMNYSYDAGVEDDIKWQVKVKTSVGDTDTFD